MKYLSILVAFILTFSFCQNKEKIGKTLEKEPVFRLSEHYSKFKFHDLTEFKIDSLDYDKLKTRYKGLDSSDTNQIIQSDKELSSYQLSFYSTFTDSSLVALIGETNDELGLIIWLLKYDSKGELKGKIAIASSWGDAGDAWHTFSRLERNNIFIRTHISESDIGNDLEELDNQVDSTITKIQFQTDNELRIDTIFKNQEIIKNKKK